MDFINRIEIRDFCFKGILANLKVSVNKQLFTWFLKK